MSIFNMSEVVTQSHSYCNRWEHMMLRCYDERNSNYPGYGGRGIKVCKRWHNIKNFIKDIGNIPKGMSLDRIDNDGDYKPSNVRWANHKTQANNRRNNQTVTWNGKTKTIVEWSRQTGITCWTLRRRFAQGWNVNRAMTTPVRDVERVVQYKGKRQSIIEWSNELGLNRQTIASRLDAGWSYDDVFNPALQFNGNKGKPRGTRKPFTIDYEKRKDRYVLRLPDGVNKRKYAGMFRTREEATEAGNRHTSTVA